MRFPASTNASTRASDREALVVPAPQAIAPSLPVLAAATQMSAAGANCLPVVENARFVGHLTARAIAAFWAEAAIEPVATVGPIVTALPLPLPESEFTEPTARFLAAERLCRARASILPLLAADGSVVGAVTEDSLWHGFLPVDWLKLRQVGEIEPAAIAVATPTATLTEIARLMLARDVCVVAIVGTAGIVGMLSDRDLLQLVALGLPFSEYAAETAMNCPAPSASPQASLERVQQLMQQWPIQQILTVDSAGEPVGALSACHLLGALAPEALFAFAAGLQRQTTRLEAVRNELTEQNQQLAASNAELTRATHLKDEFLANMSHELRTPLNAILGLSEGTLGGLYGSLTTEQKSALTTIERSGLHLLALIDDVLDVAKIGAGRVQLALQPVDIISLCKSSVAFIERQAASKHLQVETQFPPALPTVLLDERRMRQVSINLLSNAVKFTPEGGRIFLEVRCPTSGAATSPGDTIDLQLIVRDTGIGIAPDRAKHLFQPFVQVDSALNRQYSGTGLGLVLVKRLVELHGGQVSLESEFGAGSCFTVTLSCTIAAPCSDAPAIDKPAADDTNAPAGQMSLQSVPLILLAEDNKANVFTISGYLRAKGYEVVVASNGREAIRIARAEARPDLILMDIQMPDMDGIEAMGRLRQDDRTRDIPIVALTALAMAGDRERCLEAGADAYFQKPVTLKKLASQIRALLTARERAPPKHRSETGKITCPA